MATNTRKIGIGALLIVASTAIILGTGQLGDLHPAFASVAALGMAAGALLVGTAEDARPV